MLRISPQTPPPSLIALTGVLLVGDGLALGGHGVLEDLHGVLHHLPLQAHLQRVVACRHVLGQQELRLGPQPPSEGDGLLRAQPCGTAGQVTAGAGSPPTPHPGTTHTHTHTRSHPPLR